MDRLIIERKLDSLQRCLASVRDKTPADVVTLESDLDLQDVLVLNELEWGVTPRHTDLRRHRRAYPQRAQTTPTGHHGQGLRPARPGTTAGARAGRAIETLGGLSQYCRA